MANRSLRVLAVACLVLCAAGCSSSKSSGSGGSSRGRTVTIGVVADMTGLAASNPQTYIQGVQAGIALAKQDGYTIRYVVADTQSSPTGALTAAQRLIDQDHVTAIVSASALFFAAAPFVASHHIPVVGLQSDGPEWATDANMFSIGGIIRTNLVLDVYGKFFKMEGATTIGTVGYGISPNSSEYAKSVALSAQHAGLKVGYVNANFPFGTTNVGPAVLGMKNSGVDGFYAATVVNTAFALLTGLRQQGVPPKAALLPTGYGYDILSAGAAAIQAAQGVYFTISAEPVELHTAATERFQKYLADVGVTSEPGFNTYVGYGSIGLLLSGLQAAGNKLTPQSVTAGLSSVHNWDFVGLWAGRTLDINNRTDTALEGSPGNCGYYVKLVGTTFQPVQGASPLCGSVISGLSVRPGA